MKKKVRFGEIGIGTEFEWVGLELKKDGMRTATSKIGRKPFVFSIKDMVSVDQPDDEDDYIVPGIGYVGGMSNSQNDPQDLYDAYVYSGSSGVKDKCN